MKKYRLINRLRQLYILEFLNAFLLPFGFWLFSSSRNQELGLNTIAAMTLNAILLFEGGYLWFSITRQLQHNGNYDFIRILKKLKAFNFGLGILMVMILIVTPFVSTLDRIGTALFFSLAVLEHVNYFEFQLMYDSKNDIQYLWRYKRLKVAKLKRLMLNLADMDR